MPRVDLQSLGTSFPTSMAGRVRQVLSTCLTRPAIDVASLCKLNLKTLRKWYALTVVYYSTASCQTFIKESQQRGTFFHVWYGLLWKSTASSVTTQH